MRFRRCGMVMLRHMVLAGLVVCFLPAVASAWWNNAWGLRRKLVFNNSGQPSNLTDFPVLIRLDSTRVEYFRTQNAGQDIRFVDADDMTLLDHEIELWNEAGSSYVWVRVPQVDASSTTDYIWMYYDNPAAADGQNAAGVWDTDFKMVQHLNETSGPHTDSTSNTNDSAIVDVQPPQGGPGGQIDGADLFSAASTDNIDVTDDPTLNVGAGETLTVEAWFRTSTTGTFQHIASKEVAPGAGWDLMVWDSNQARFTVYDDAMAPPNATAMGGAAVTDNNWHYIVGRWNRALSNVRVFVDGTSVGTGTNALLAGSSFANAQPFVIGEEGDANRGFNFDGAIDEVRFSKVFRSNDWIQAQYLSMSDTFASYGPAMCVGTCNALGVVEGGAAASFTVTNTGAFEMVFATAAGGSIEQLYDRAEDPPGAPELDLAGTIAASAGPLGLHNFGISVAGPNYNAAANDTGSRLHILEATPTRVRLRQDAFYQNGPGGPILTGVKAQGDYSIYPAGKVALHWDRQVTAPAGVPYSTEYKELTIHRLNAPVGSPLNTWTVYGDTAAAFPHVGLDDYLLAQNENTSASPGVKTDVLDILYKDWTVANGYPGQADNNNFTINAAAERLNFWWVELTAGTLPFGRRDTWDSLTYIKPTIFVNGVDTAVASRSADYRLPSPLGVTVGGPWLLASENTGGGDDFNEAEAAYALTLDPALGLTFDIDGTVANPRYHPFFKIRHWRSLAGPASVTLEGAALTSGVDYRADVKPLSRAHFANQLSWHSTLEDANSLGVNLDVGSSGGQFGVTYAAGKYGNGVVIDDNADSVVAGSAASLDFNVGSGAVEFWYQPNYPNLDGLRHILWSTQGVGPDYFVLEKAAGTNDLVFTISNSGATTTQTVPSIGGNWAFHWLHIRTEWNSAAPVGSQLRILVNGSALPQVSGGVAYSAIGMNKGPIAFGTCGGGACPFGVDANANGIIDEAHIYGAPPQLLAYGGLTANPNEFLADPSPARNAALMNLRVDGSSRRGQYVYFGADSQFRGLNVGLYSLGTGVGDNDLVWQYWNGTAWTSLESVGGFTDTTLSFKKTGNLYWQDPPAWAPYSVSGGPDLYYVRVYLDPLAPSDYASAPVEGLIKTDILLVQYCGDITAAAQTFSIPAPVPTAVSLQSFSATGRDSALDLSWTTASEIDNLGFHLYRSLSPEGPWQRVTSSLIPGLGSSPTGASYSYRDADVQNGTTYYYLLEDVETTGRTERHGPVSATPQVADSSDNGNPGGDSGSIGGSGSGARITYGDPGSASLREIERGPSHVVLELLTPGFTATTEADGTVRLEIPGFDDEASLPGSLAVPVRHALVEAVAGRRVRLASVVPDDIVSFDSFRLSAAGSREVVVDEEGVVRASRASRRLLESSRQGGFAPRLWARLLGTLFQADTKKASLELSPLRHDPASGRTLLARRLTVRVEFSGTDPGERSLGGARGRRAQVQARPATKGLLAQLVVDSPGLYRVRFEDVFGTKRRAGVNVRSLRLSHLGQSVAYHLEPDKALFAPGSSLFFLSDGSSLNPLGDVVYELALGQSALRMNVASGAPSGSDNTEYLETVKLEENRFYQSALLTAPDLWLWDLMVSPVTKSYPFPVNALSPSFTSSHLRVVLQGASDFEEMDHHLRLSVNGIPVAETTWDGKQEQVVEAEMNAGILVEGTNTLALENVGDAGAAYSMVFLNRFQVTYPRLLQAAAGRLEGRFEQSGRSEISGLATGPSTTGLSSASLVVDTTSAPVWLTSLEPTPTGLAFRSETGASYLALSDTALVTPQVRRPAGTNLASKANRAHWVLIAPREFLPTAKPLLELRRSQGLRAKTVALEDVYAEFGFGEPSAKAIHDFLSFAFHNWRTPPRYVVLLGDATYDPKDYLKTGVKDRVPTPIVETTYLWTASDPSLAAVNGADALPDLAIGRLSAGTFEEAQRLVDKLLAFEQAGRIFDGKAILVADNADLAGNFEANQDEIASSVLQNRETQKLYLRDLGTSLRSEILAAFDNGPGIVSYVGHGATAVWASENVLNNLDVASLQPQAQQPLLLTLNCLNGFFHFPPLDSLAEALVKAEGKGALAAFSPSGLSVNDAAHLFHKALLTQIESGTHQRLGDVVLAAQQDYANSGAMPELLNIYHLLGDPAMRIR